MLVNRLKNWWIPKDVPGADFESMEKEGEFSDFVSTAQSQLRSQVDEYFPAAQRPSVIHLIELLRSPQLFVAFGINPELYSLQEKSKN